MPGRCLEVADLAVEVPDRLVGVGVVVGEEPAGVGLGEDAGVAPALAGGGAGLLGDRAEVEDVDHQQVAGLGALDLDGAAEHVGVGQVDVADVVGRVVVAELGVGPLAALDPELAAGLHRGGTGDVGVPAVVAGDGLVAHGLGLVDAEHHVWHERHLPCWVAGCLVLSLAAVPAGGERARPPSPPAATAEPGARWASGSLVGTAGIRAGRSSDRGPSGALVDWCWVPTGCSPGSTPRTRPGNRALDATARRRARVWEGARGRDSVKQDVVVGGAGAPGRPPAGSRGLPPHAPASWQGAWVSGRSSARRRSAWRPDHSSGTPPSPWPYPSASAARNSRSHHSDSRRWPQGPPKVRRSEA